MAVTAKVSASELSAQINNRFVGKYAEARLINAPGVEYQPGITNDSTFLAFEVTEGVGGYTRRIIAYSVVDVTQYTDDGVGLNTKGTVFAHDGSDDPISFTHVALCWSSGNIITLTVPTSDPDVGVDGIYTDLPTITDGDGYGLTLDLEVANDIFVFTVSSPGENYAIGDQIQVLEATMASVGAIPSGQDLGNAVMTVEEVSINADSGNLITVAKPANPVVLTAGNEAAFYWNLKLYGFNDLEGDSDD